MKKIMMVAMMAVMMVVVSVQAEEEEKCGYGGYAGSNYVNQYGEPYAEDYSDYDESEAYVYADDSADVEEEWPEDLYHDEYQAASYGFACLTRSASFTDGMGNLICTISEGEQITLLESIGASGEKTHISYNGIKGYILTEALLTQYEDVTYDENGAAYGEYVQLQCDANLRSMEDGSVIAFIPSGIGVQLIRFDENTGRYIVIWNGLCGTVYADAIVGGTTSEEEQEEEVDNSDENQNATDSSSSSSSDCTTDVTSMTTGGAYNFGLAEIKSKIGANLRDEYGRVICTLPYGEQVKLLEELNFQTGRTRVLWGKYVGTVLTACLIDRNEDSSSTNNTASSTSTTQSNSNCCCGCGCCRK